MNNMEQSLDRKIMAITLLSLRDIAKENVESIFMDYHNLKMRESELDIAEDYYFNWFIPHYGLQQYDSNLFNYWSRLVRIEQQKEHYHK